MHQLQIPFSSQIALKSKSNQKYLGFKFQLQTLNAQFPHPCIHTNIKPGQPIDTALKLKIIPRQLEKNAEKPNVVFEGARVYLINSFTDEYLTSTSKGELKFDKKSMNQQINKMLFKSATWTLSYASSQKSLTSPSKSPLSPFDALVLKSVYGTYLTVNPNTLVCDALLQMDEVRSVWFMQSAQSLQLPQWLYQRPSFGKHLGSPQMIEGTVVERRSLRSHPPELQQALLVQDILDVSLGFQGTYVKRRPGSNLFVIEPHLQTSVSNSSSSIGLHQLTYRILQLTSHYEKLMGFVKKLEFSQGILVQALGDGLRRIISQYYQQIILLDEQAAQGLSLQKMWVQIQDSLKVMKALGELISAAKDLRGGQLLSCLQKLINETTDGFVLKIYKILLERLVSLYVNMLSKWIYEGIIEDRYQQFMVKLQERVQGEWNSWEERFTLRAEQVPALLQRDQQKVLVTGKYLNILKACNRQIHCPFAKDIEQHLEYHISRQNFTEPIQRAYDWANQQLLQLVFGQCRLMEVLTSLKGYYFLRFGDLFVHFLDAAQQDLFAQKKSKTDGKARPFSVQKLQNLFDINVRTSSAASDQCKEEVSCRLDTATVFEQVHRIKTLQSQVFDFDFSEKPFLKKDSKYIDFVTLDFKCEFPLNLILNKKTISKYQALFRLMIWCKFMQRQLGSCWMRLQSLKEIQTMDKFKTAYSINHRILTFVKSLIYYLSEEVVQQNWFKLSAQLKKAQNFEQIIQCHDRFLNNCLKESLLTNGRLLPLLTADIGSTIYNYVSLKGYLSKIQQELNIIKHSDSKPFKPNQLKQYKRHINKRIEQFIELEEFKEFLFQSAKAFGDGINTFIREISLSTKKEENHLLRLSEMLEQQNFIPRRSKVYP